MTRRYHLHMPGLVYLAVVLLIGLAAVNSQNNLLFWLFGVLFSGLLISGLVSGIMMMGLRVRRLDPRHGVVGVPLAVRYSVSNRYRLVPAFSVHVEDRPAGGQASWRSLVRPGEAWVMHVGPRETVHGEAIFVPLGRGEAVFDMIRIWTTFPFGLVKKSITFSQPQHVFIHPRLFELRRGVMRAMVPHLMLGSKISSRPGSGDDYFGLREHQPGDSLRHIAWKQTARRDQLISIERSQPSLPRARIVLNLTVPTDDLARNRMTEDEARELEERAISLAASFVRAGHLGGYEIGLSVLGSDQPPIPLRGDRRHERRIMAALAAIHLDAPRITTRFALGPETERAALIVIHPDRIDPGIGRADAFHVSATQLEHLVVRPVDPEPPTAHADDAPVPAKGAAA